MLIKKGVLILFVIGCRLVVNAQLIGSYTVGGENPDFATPNLAIDVLNELGSIGPVTLQLRPGLYDEPLWVSVEYMEFPLTIESEFGVADDVQLVIEKFFLSNTTVKNIQIHCNSVSDTPSYQEKGLEIAASNVVFDSCIIKPSIDQPNVDGFSYLPGYTNLTIRNCRFEDLDYAFFVRHISPFGLPDEHQGITLIENNIFENVRYPIKVRPTSEDLRIYNNTLIEPEIGIELGQGNIGAVIVDGNTVIEASVNSFRVVHTLNGGFCIVRNNFFIGGEVSSNFNPIESTVYINQSDPVLFHSNSVIGALNIFIAAPNTMVQVKNCIFKAREGLCMDIGEGYYTGENNLFCDEDGGIGVYFGSDQISISEFVQEEPSEVGSFIGNPEFFSSSDLHLSSGIALNNGLSLPYVLLDIDGEPRDPISPDIGADESSGVFIQERVRLDDVLIYPVPARSEINLVTVRPFENSKVNILNSEGKVVQHKKVSGRIEKLDVSSLDSGIYFLQFDNFPKELKKFVKL